ncbi:MULTISPECIES: ATPase domain-containing protein [unclassified Duganella]|jgi:circadian clock protein KaiC|uniref:ATPase domain-containing protein n=1 Tax=unclassified Duganella TaxID=2636909 RepID=UPI00088E7023|nr:MULTISPECIES: ATPase domain-containing protein [unclassified Duganella]SDG04117.1 circadian clock protein KaiC [Duganella sp. OV458]SDJ01285.1 circadian clock protein KaiC [Duganella sp. OV510]
MHNRSPQRIPLLKTLVPGLDDILGGGFPAHSLYLIQGLAGSGKTTLACQIGFEHARQGKKVLILTLIAETHGKMLNHLSNFSFFDDALVDDRILFIGAYNDLLRGGLRELLKSIAATLAEQRPDIMIIDGFRTVREAKPSDLALSEFMLSLNSLVSTMECTTFLLSPTEGNQADSENTLVDGLIELSQYERGLQLIREMKVFKLRGSKHLLGRHVFEVGEDGIAIYPRLEAVSTLSAAMPPGSRERLGFGIAGWDRLTNGGVAKGSTTALLGNPGVGKTLMGLHFIHEGLQRGEQALIVGFYESPQRLLEKARSVGMELQPYFDNGALQIIWHPPLEVLVDSLAQGTLENIARRNVGRLLIDGVDGLREIVMHEGRWRAFLAAFVNELRVRNVTTFFTQELPYFGHGPMENDAAASILFENIILMRYVDVAGINLRQIGVLKLRENSYDAANHVLLISDQGMSIDGAVPPTVPPILNR